jgi:uncharacterized protein
MSGALINRGGSMTVAVSRGTFVWHDLMTTDPKAAIAFYSKVVGWGTQDWEGPSPYTMWTTGSDMVGGVMQLPPDAQSPPHWLGYVSTANVDDAVGAATNLGATVLHPATDIPTVGRFAVLSDPQGAAFAIYSSSNPTPPPADPTPKAGEFSWHELATTDPEAGFDFYQKLFGWQKTEAMDMGAEGVYQMFGFDGIPFGGIYRKPAQMPGPPAWCHYAKVDDVEKAVEAVKAAGGQVINGPMEVPGGDMIAQGIDPQGAMFAVHASKK